MAKRDSKYCCEKIWEKISSYESKWVQMGIKGRREIFSRIDRKSLKTARKQEEAKSSDSSWHFACAVAIFCFWSNQVYARLGQMLLFQFYIHPIISPSLPYGTNLDKIAMHYGMGEIKGLCQNWKVNYGETNCVNKFQFYSLLIW